MTARAEVLAALAGTALAVARSVAAQDRLIGRDGWGDILRFRRCIEERRLEAWSPWVLHSVVSQKTSPTIFCQRSTTVKRVL